MPIYSITAPNGRTYEIEGPPGATQDEVVAEILRRDPSAGQAPSTERTMGEAVKDVGAGVVKGVGSLVQLPGQAYGLVTGDWSDTGALGLGRRIEAAGEEMKSEGLKAREAERQRKVQEAEAEGQLAAFKTSFMETVKDPALLSSFVAEQLPQLLPIIATGGTAAAATAGRASAAALAKGATKEAAAQAARAAAVKAGTTAAIHTGAAMQGTDVGASTYDAIYQRVLDQDGTPEQAAEAALNRARAAGVTGYGLSVLANRYLPGGQALEKALVGQGTGLGMLKAGAIGMAKEVPSEMTEEVGGALARNVAVRGVDPTQSLAQGLGETAAQAAIGAAALGGAAGAYSGRGLAPKADRKPQEEPQPAPPEPQVEDETDDDNDVDLPVSADAVQALEELAARREAAGDVMEARELRKIAERRRQELQKVELRAHDEQVQQVVAGIESMPYEDLAKARASLQSAPQTPTTKAAVKAITERMRALDLPRVQAAQRGNELAKDSAFGQEMPDLFGMYYPPLEQDGQQEQQAGAQPIYDPRQREMFPYQQDMFGAAPQEPVERAESPAAEPERNIRAATLQAPLPFNRPTRRAKDGQRNRATRTGDALDARAVEPSVAAPVEPAGDARPADAQQPGAPDRAGVGDLQPVSRDAAGDARGDAPALTELPAESEPELDIERVPTPVVRLQQALEAGQVPQNQTRRALDTMMDELIEIQQNPQHPEHEQAGNYITRNIKDEAFERALRQAEARARQRRASQPEPVAQGPAQPTREEVTDADLYGTPVGGQGELFTLPEGYERAQSLSDRVREVRDLEAQRAEAWSQVPDVKRAKEAQLPLPLTQEAPRKGGPRFSTAQPKPAPRNPISHTELERAVQRVTRALGLPEDGITILDDVRQFAPGEAPGSRSGAMKDDQIVLFRSGIESGVEGEKTILHELFHRGLHRLLPQNEYLQAMDRLYRQFPQVREAADTWLTDPQNAADVAKYDPAMQWAIATEESMAILAESRMPASALRRLGNWIANLASRLGLKRLASAIRQMGTTELEALIDSVLRQDGVPANAAPGTTRFRSKPPAEKTAAGRRADAILTKLDMQPPPRVTAVEKAVQASVSAVENPAMTAQSLKEAVSRWVDKFGNAVFSSNFAFNARVRQAVQGTINSDPAAMGMLLSVTDAQVDGSAVLGGLFIKEGNLRYDPELYKMVAERGISLLDVATTISQMGAKHGLTAEQASQVMDSYFEARRTQRLLERNAELEQDARVYEMAGMKKKARETREKIVTGLRSPEWVQQAMELETLFPELTKAAEQWNTVRKNATKLMVDSGLWTAEQAEDMLSAAEYVPFYREGQTEAGKGPKEFMTGLQVRARERRLRGSERQVNDIFDNMVRWTQFAVERSVRNRMAQTRIDVALQLGMAEELPYDAKGGKDRNVVTVWRDGIERKYQLDDPLLVDAFAGLESIALPSLQWWAKLTNLFRQSVVLNPLFGILQVPQDAIAAIYTSGLKPRYAFTVPARAVKEFLATLLTPEGSAAHRELRKVGAVGVKDVTAEVVRMDLEVLEGAQRELGMARPLVRKISKALHHVAMASDSAVRQAVYTAAMDQGLSRAEAMEKAFQIINFRNRGTSKGLAMAARVVPFLNAYVAAQHVAYKTITGSGTSPTDRAAALQTLAATTAGMLVLSTLYAMALGGDEGYEKRPLYVRDRVLVIPGTGGLSIPMRSDIFAFPKVLAEHMWHHITEDGTLDGANTRRSMTDLLANSVVGPYAPQAIKPAVEVAINYDFFRQRPIVGTSLSGAAGEHQFTDSTSELSKAIGAGTGLSPAKLDHLIRGYLGSLGGLIMFMSNDAIALAMENPRPEMPLWDAIASFPGASTLLPKQNDSAARQDFYELKEAVDRVTQTLTLLNGRSPEQLDKYLSDPVVEARYGLSSEVRAIYEDLSEIRKAITLIRNDPEVSAAQKRADIEELRQAELELLSSLPLKEMRREAKL